MRWQCSLLHTDNAAHIRCNAVCVCSILWSISNCCIVSVAELQDEWRGSLTFVSKSAASYGIRRSWHWFKYFEHTLCAKNHFIFQQKLKSFIKRCSSCAYDYVSNAAAAALMIASRCNSNHFSLCTYCPGQIALKIKARHTHLNQKATKHKPARLQSESIESSPDTARPTKYTTLLINELSEGRTPMTFERIAAMEFLRERSRGSRRGAMAGCNDGAQWRGAMAGCSGGVQWWGAMAGCNGGVQCEVCGGT